MFAPLLFLCLFSLMMADPIDISNDDQDEGLDIGRRYTANGGCRSGVIYSHYTHQNFHKAIQFSPPFARKPHLVYGMMHVDFSNHANMRLNTWITSLSAHGFTYHMKTWAGSKVYKIGTRWMACP